MMRKQRGLYLSSTVLSVLLHLIFFFTVAVSLKTCTGPVSIATQPPSAPIEAIEAEVITQQEVNAYYERKQQKTLAKERALQLEKEQQERAQRLAEERKKAELLRQKKLQEEKNKQEEARLEQLRIETQEKQQQTELRHKEELAEEKKKQLEEEKRLAEEKRRLEEEKKKQLEEEKRLAEEKRRLEEEKEKQLEEEKRLAEEKRRLEEEKKKKQLEEERRRLAEHRKKEEAERLKMRKKQIAIWQRQYEQMIRSSVEQHWKKPPTSVKGGECVLKIRQDETGAILNVNFIRCEGDKLFVRSVEEAVWKAHPLPAPPSPEVFDSEIEFTFKRDY